MVAPLRLGGGIFSEAWLQKLVQSCPEVLPVDEVEPGFGKLIPVAMEVPCSQGSIDNVFLSSDGDIVICELKLWRNPQARREVVAQSLDYISALSQMSYEEFENACLAGTMSSNAASLYELLEKSGDALDEASFVDAVSRNLEKGRILALAVGDGIRSQAESLANLLTRNAQSQFSFALVELSIFQDHLQGYFIVPSVLAKTHMIPRHIFIPVPESGNVNRLTVGGAQDEVLPPVPRGSITETQFYEIMSQRSASLPGDIRRFLEKLEKFGVYPEWKASLNLYRDDPAGGRPINAGYIQKNGQFYTSTAGWFGRSDLAAAYHTGVADLIGGKIYRPDGEWHDCYATVDGKSAPRIEQLLPEHEDALVQLVSEYIQRVLTES